MVLKFVISARNAGDVLPRVVILFHRSAVGIESIHVPARRKKRRDLKITITVDGRHTNARRMPAILEKAVDVLSVEVCRSGASSSQEQTERLRGETIG
jgi:acetolactate synthase small subunit